jgi:hypothetical protein
MQANLAPINSKTTGVIIGPRTGYPSGAHDFISVLSGVTAVHLD